MSTGNVLNPPFEAPGVVPTTPTTSMLAASAAPAASTPGGTIGIQVGYVDPNNPVPYTPATPVDMTPTLPAAAALPPQQPIHDLGATNRAGGVAYLGDQLLRGFMQGRAVAQQNMAIRTARTSQGLYANYDAAAKNLYDVAKSGVPKQSHEYQDALNRATSAWGAYMNFVGNHVAPTTQKGSKKTGSSGTSATKQPNLLQRIFQPGDPSQVAPAVYEAMQKLGPPVLHQISQFDNPQYQRQLQAQGQLATAKVQTEFQQAQNMERWQQLAAKPARTPEEQKEFDTLTDIFGKATHQPSVASLTRYGKGPNGEEEEWQIDLEGNEVPNTRRPRSASGGAKAGSPQAFNEAYARFAVPGGISVADLPPAVDLYLEHTYSWGKLHPQYSIRDNIVVRKEATAHGTVDVPVTIRELSSKGIPPPPQPPKGWPSVQDLDQLMNGSRDVPIPFTAATSVESTPSAISPRGPARAHHAPGGVTTPKTGPNANVSIGNPLYQVPDAAYNAELTTYRSLQDTYNTGQKLASNLNPATSYALSQLFIKAQNSIGKGVARITKAEQDKVTSLGSISQQFLNKWYSGTRGTLDPAIAQQMVDSMKDMRDAVGEGVKNSIGATSPTPSPAPVPSSGFDPSKDIHFVVGH